MHSTPLFRNIDLLRNQTRQTLTEFTDKIIYICILKHIQPESINDDVSSDMHFVFKMYIFFLHKHGQTL